MPINPSAYVAIDFTLDPAPVEVLPRHPFTEISGRRLIEVCEGITGGGGGGGLTDTQLRATPVQVSEGSDITTPSPAMPAGGVGVRGWLSAIWTKINATLNITGVVSVSELLAIVDAFNSVMPVVIKKVVGSTYSPLPFKNLGVDNAKNIKASAGNVYSISCYNVDTTGFRFFQLFDTATFPGLGAVPVFSFAVPAKSQIIVGTDFFNEQGIFFATGIAFGFSTTPNTFTGGTAASQNSFVNYK